MMGLNILACSRLPFFVLKVPSTYTLAMKRSDWLVVVRTRYSRCVR